MTIAIVSVLTIATATWGTLIWFKLEEISKLLGFIAKSIHDLAGDGAKVKLNLDEGESQALISLITGIRNLTVSLDKLPKKVK